MASPRFLAPDGYSHAIYHCVSRVVERAFVLRDGEKRQFLHYMRLYEGLCGVRVLTHCLMDNHFHILVEVPRRPEVLPTNEELLERVRAAHGTEAADHLARQFEAWAKAHNHSAIEAERERWFRQMWNLAAFMKVLKQRFSQWYNGTRPKRRTGTLWEERYRSMLVEDGEALRAMAAYIDLNPIRAGLVKDPKDYRWSGYGEACAGQAPAMAGLRWMAERNDPLPPTAEAASHTPKAADVLAWYRQVLYGRGEEVRDAEGRVIKRGFTEEEIQAVRDAGGHLPTVAYLRQKVRYLTDGLVLGTQSFVEAIFQAHRHRFSATRTTASRRLHGLELQSPLRVARALAVRRVG